ncbi:MAG: hypothetical protein IPK14_05740 [Blastocatellia bacterium]|nr:hypothetical protein [Blastocatellia bacterium]
MSVSKKNQPSAEQDVQKKLKVLGILCGAVVLILAYQYFFAASSIAPNTEKATTTAQTDKSKRVPWNQVLTEQNPKDKNASTAGYVPVSLDVDALANKLNSGSEVGRNLFDYPPPPPPPPIPPPPPPTIVLNSVSPTSVYAKTKPFEVVVRGSNFSLNMRLYLNGNPNFAQTILVSDSEIKALVPANYFDRAGRLRFELKVPGQEVSFFSKPLEISVLEPEDPNRLFKIIGHFTDPKGNPATVLAENGGNPNNPKTTIAKVDDTIFNKWKVISINKGTMELEDVKQALGVRWPVKMKEESASGVSVSYANSNAYQNNAYQQAQYDELNNVNNPTLVNLNEANTAGASPNGNQVLGETAEDQERNKKINAENIKTMNEMFKQQREALIRQRQELIKDLPKNPRNPNK